MNSEIGLSILNLAMFVNPLSGVGKMVSPIAKLASKIGYNGISDYWKKYLPDPYGDLINPLNAVKRAVSSTPSIKLGDNKIEIDNSGFIGNDIHTRGYYSNFKMNKMDSIKGVGGALIEDIHDANDHFGDSQPRKIL